MRARLRAVVVAAVAAVAFGGCRAPSRATAPATPIVRAAGARPAAMFGTISADNHELRDAFNADAGKVRVVMLVSPS